MTASHPSVTAEAARSACAAWDPSDAVSEMFGAGACAWEVWTGYLTRVALARGPMDLLEAGARLTLESADICTRVAAGRLREAGVRAPLLNDA